MIIIIYIYTHYQNIYIYIFYHLMTGDGDAVGGFLQLHDAATLRRACEAAAEHAAPRAVAVATVAVATVAVGPGVNLVENHRKTTGKP